MATYENTRSLDASFGSRLSQVMSSFVGTVSDWNDARVTRKALSRLSARELDDIGLCRGDIDLIAARGPRA